MWGARFPGSSPFFATHSLHAPSAFFGRPFGPLCADETATLTFKSKGGNPFPVNFTPSHFEAFVTSGNLVYHMTKDSSRKRLIQTLEEAKNVKSPDYLLLATPFESVADLERFTRRHASGLEQQTTRCIAKSDAFIAK